jgi:hypothetical protein
MTRNNNLFRIIALTFLFMLGMTSVYAAGGLNVVLSSQNPDPVTPGNFVYVNVKVSNSGTSSLPDVGIRLIENDNFQIAQGSDINQNLGAIPALSNLDSSSGFVIAKCKLLVDEKTPLGLNTIEFEVRDGSQIYTYDFDILVQDANPSIRVGDFKAETVEPGKSTKLTIDLVNDNTIDLKNVIVSLDLSNVQDSVFSTISGSNQKIIGLLSPGKTKTVEYNLVTDPTASSKSYNIPVIIEYDDALGNSFTSNGLASVQVYSAPLLSVKLDSQDSFTTGANKVTLAVSNPGTSSIKGTQIEIMSSDNYEVIEGQFQYVGDLNPDDFQTVQANLYVKSNEDFNVVLKVKYLDSYNTVNEDVIEIPVKVFTNTQLKEFGLAAASSSSALGSVFGFIVLVLIIAGAYVLGRKKGFKKGKSSRKD